MYEYVADSFLTKSARVISRLFFSSLGWPHLQPNIFRNNAFRWKSKDDFPHIHPKCLLLLYPFTTSAKTFSLCWNFQRRFILLSEKMRKYFYTFLLFFDTVKLEMKDHKLLLRNLHKFNVLSKLTLNDILVQLSISASQNCLKFKIPWTVSSIWYKIFQKSFVTSEVKVRAWSMRQDLL